MWLKVGEKIAKVQEDLKYGKGVFYLPNWSNYVRFAIKDRAGRAENRLACILCLLWWSLDGRWEAWKKKVVVPDTQFRRFWSPPPVWNLLQSSCDVKRRACHSVGHRYRKLFFGIKCPQTCHSLALWKTKCTRSCDRGWGYEWVRVVQSKIAQIVSGSVSSNPPEV